ncbi:MAG: hypothetical protein K0M45_09560 [Candidatus Paracaedibacteraceae bacterium]|nr:hypothetical protein [Candidatus Paracaedibacteraceae bacterium]
MSTRKNYYLASVLYLLTYLNPQAMEKNEKEIFNQYYTAPSLNEYHIVKKGICIRPGHTQPNYDLAIEKILGKTVITTSGFGGSGITLGEGAV